MEILHFTIGIDAIFVRAASGYLCTHLYEYVGERTKNNRRSLTVYPRVKVTTDAYVRTYYIYCTHTVVPSPGPETVYVFT